MKKFFNRIVLTLALVFSMCSFASAQTTAIETSKLTDNMYIGVHAGVTAPISSFSLNEIFPLNSAFGLTVGKQVTPILGFNIEGTTWLGSNASKPATNRFDSYIGHNAFRAVNVGINGTLNFSNLFNGYKGKPQAFEWGFEGGFGWLHLFRPNIANRNALSAKTQLNFLFNIGSSRAHTIGLSPVIYWNLTGDGMDHGIKVDRRNAQLGLMLSYTYHFKNSNGTHYFKVYDIDAMNDEIASLMEQNAVMKKAIENFKPETSVETKTEYVAVPSLTVVYFAVNDATLDAAGKAELDKIPAGTTVTIEGTASPEGTEKHNLELSQMRADVVAEHLKANNVEVVSAKGMGVATGGTSNRVAIVRPLLKK